jgi:dephospho-CoA kinase
MYEHVLYPNVGKHKNENWYYGRTIEAFYSGNLVIMTPAGIAQMSQKDLDESYIIFLNIAESIRRERLNLRSDADDIERRIASDEKDFENFTKYNHIINSHEFTLSGLKSLIDTIFKNSLKQQHI